MTNRCSPGRDIRSDIARSAVPYGNHTLAVELSRAAAKALPDRTASCAGKSRSKAGAPPSFKIKDITGLMTG